MPDVGLSISVDDAHRDKMPEVAEKTRKLGLKIDQRMDAIGVITGSIDASKVDELRHVPGVSNVEVSRKIEIAPPDRDVQ